MNTKERHEYARHRLYVDEALGYGQAVTLDRAAANYLFNVLRLGVGDAVLLFNGRDGEWLGQIAQAGKRSGVAKLTDQVRKQDISPDLWLAFAPLKKERTAFVVEKAVEMGVARLCPVFTEFTNTRRVNAERMQAHVIEAAEQCERLTIPSIASATSLEALLTDWPDDRVLIFANERAAPGGAWAALQQNGTQRAGLLIGPEGGFSLAETGQILALPQCLPLSLGPRILRADTAAVAGLALWQTACGDWQ